MFRRTRASSAVARWHTISKLCSEGIEIIRVGRRFRLVRHQGGVQRIGVTEETVHQTRYPGCALDWGADRGEQLVAPKIEVPESGRLQTDQSRGNGGDPGNCVAANGDATPTVKVRIRREFSW